MKRSIKLATAGALLLGLLAAAIPSMRSLASQGSGCLPTTGTVSGLTFAQGVNAAIAALLSSNSGASAPANDCTAAPVKGQLWLDTSVTPNVLKQYDGAAWIVIGAQDATNHLWSPPIGGGNAAVTAASTTDICAAPAAVQTISGTTTITSFGSACVVGVRKTLLFSSATPLTYNATSLILPGQRSYTAAAGDVADAIYIGSGNWRVVSITKIDGSSVINPSVPVGTVLYGNWGTIPAKTVYGAAQALSRTTYPDYLAASTRTQTGTLTAGNNTIASVGNTAGLGPGMPLEGTGIQSGATIASVTASTIVMSATATVNGVQNVTAFVTGYGAGGDSTTVGVTDCRGRAMAGRDNAGGSAVNRLTASYFNAATAMNVGGGSQSSQLGTDNLPPHTHGISITSGVEPQGHNHSTSVDVITGVNALAGGGSNVIFVDPTSGQKNGTRSITSGGQSAGHTHSVVGDTNNGPGLQLAFSNVPPTVIAECVVAVLP